MSITINERDRIIASERDSQIFFDAITSPKQPSESLKNALKDYTLSNNSIPLSHFSKKIQSKLPESYTSIPTTLLGRLAVDKKYQGKGIGKILLIDALKRSFTYSQEIGSFAVVVDPVDNDARKFYEKYDFICLPDSNKMFLSIKTLEELFS